MSINTKFMGIDLNSPIIVGSSILTNSSENLKKAEDYGAGALVIKSLFEEQILADSGRNLSEKDIYNWYPEAIRNLEGYSESDLIEHYLNLIEFVKKNLTIPVFASINCVSAFDWPQFAVKFEEAGVDAIELNIVVPPSDESSSGDDICLNISNIITSVREHCTIPVSVKLAPYFTNHNTALRQIDESGIDGLVLFNRLYTPDIDIDSISVVNNYRLSGSGDISTSLRWITLLSDLLKSDIAGSGGVKDYSDILKYLLAGAKAVQVTSCLIVNGLEYIKELNSGICEWMNSKNFESINDFRGLINQNPEFKKQFNRVQYLRFDT